MNITLETIKQLHTELWDEAIAEHGDKFKVPFERIQEMSQWTRALYVLQTWNGTGNPARYLSVYSIPTDVITYVLAKYCNEIVSENEILAPKPRRADKYDAFLDWAKGHLFEQFTTEQLEKVSDFSYATTLKFITESPTFRKVKKGLWEIRDAESDRKAEKS